MDITNTDTDVTDDEDLVGAIQNREQSLDNDGSSEASGDYILTDDDTIPSDDSIDDDPKIMMPSIDREERINVLYPEVSAGSNPNGPITVKPDSLSPVSEEAEAPLDKQTKLLISLLLGIGCLTCITMILLFSVHRYKKKDEGSYEVHGYYTPGKQF